MNVSCPPVIVFPKSWGKECEFVSVQSVGAKNKRCGRVSEARDKSGAKDDCS
jgi:hypothetical protein